MIQQLLLGLLLGAASLILPAAIVWFGFRLAAQARQATRPRINRRLHIWTPDLSAKGRQRRI